MKTYKELKEILNGKLKSEFLSLEMRHDDFVEFSNKVRDGKDCDLIFIDEETRDIYTPDGSVRMTYLSREDCYE